MIFRRFLGPVLLRVNYRRGGAYEIRLSALTCIVDRHNKIVDAYSGPPKLANR